MNFLILWQLKLPQPTLKKLHITSENIQLEAESFVKGFQNLNALGLSAANLKSVYTLLGNLKLKSLAIKTVVQGYENLEALPRFHVNLKELELEKFIGNPEALMKIVSVSIPMIRKLVLGSNIVFSLDSLSELLIRLKNLSDLRINYSAKSPINVDSSFMKVLKSSGKILNHFEFKESKCSCDALKKLEEMFKVQFEVVRFENGKLLMKNFKL